MKKLFNNEMAIMASNGVSKAAVICIWNRVKIWSYCENRNNLHGGMFNDNDMMKQCMYELTGSMKKYNASLVISRNLFNNMGEDK
jgi:hypothetical protein